MRGRTLVTFDVDGTLIRSCGPDANRLHLEAFQRAFREGWDLPEGAGIHEVEHHGGTDPLLLLKVLEHHGADTSGFAGRLEAAQTAMCAHVMEGGAFGIEILPGVAPLLKALRARSDVVHGLVTGNLQPIGWRKMEVLGVLEDFPTPRVGGFGSDFCSLDTSNMTADRAELIRIARRRAEEAYGEIGAHIHVGDTPYDLGAAKLAGARALGVATGKYSAEELEQHLGEGQVLQDLCDIPCVLRAFGLEV